MKGGDIRKRILPPFFCLESCLIMSVDLEKNAIKWTILDIFGRIIAKIEHLKS